MNKTATAVCVTLVLLASTVSAQIGDPGDLGAFFDDNATITHTDPGTNTPFVPYDIYVMSIDTPGGQDAYEFSLDVDPRVTLTVETFFPAGATDFGVDQGNFKNYLVGTGGECYGDGTSQVLVQWQWLLFASGTDFLFCLGAAEPSSFSPARPGYLACNSPGDLRPYGAAYEGCAIANCLGGCTIANEASSWGALKHRF